MRNRERKRQRGEEKKARTIMFLKGKDIFY